MGVNNRLQIVIFGVLSLFLLFSGCIQPRETEFEKLFESKQISCENLEGVELDKCLYSLASNTKDSNICLQIKDLQLRDSCIFRVSSKVRYGNRCITFI